MSRDNIDGSIAVGSEDDEVCGRACNASAALDLTAVFTAAREPGRADGGAALAVESEERGSDAGVRDDGVALEVGGRKEVWLAKAAPRELAFVDVATMAEISVAEGREGSGAARWRTVRGRVGEEDDRTFSAAAVGVGGGPKEVLLPVGDAFAMEGFFEPSVSTVL